MVRHYIACAVVEGQVEAQLPQALFATVEQETL